MSCYSFCNYQQQYHRQQEQRKQRYSSSDERRRQDDDDKGVEEVVEVGTERERLLPEKGNRRYNGTRKSRTGSGGASNDDNSNKARTLRSTVRIMKNKKNPFSAGRNRPDDCDDDDDAGGQQELTSMRCHDDERGLHQHELVERSVVGFTTTTTTKHDEYDIVAAANPFDVDDDDDRRGAGGYRSSSSNKNVNDGGAAGRGQGFRNDIPIDDAIGTCVYFVRSFGFLFSGR